MVTIQYTVNEEEIKQHKNPIDIGLHVNDQEGRILQPLGGDGHGKTIENDKILMIDNYYFEPLDSVPESLTVQPYLRPFDQHTPKIMKKKWEGKSFTLSQGESGTILVHDVKKKRDKVTLPIKFKVI